MTTKYITTAAFRNTFFDKSGLPLIDGELYSFKASDHGCEKALYKSNIITPPDLTPPEYPNPIILDAGGSVPEPSAIFYADDEPYYLELKSFDGETILTVDSWPPETTEPTPPSDEIDVTNFFGNADFSQQIKPEFVTGELGITDTLVATPNWYYVRSNLESTINIKFEKFLF